MHLCCARLASFLPSCISSLRLLGLPWRLSALRIHVERAVSDATLSLWCPLVITAVGKRQLICFMIARWAAQRLWYCASHHRPDAMVVNLPQSPTNPTKPRSCTEIVELAIPFRVHLPGSNMWPDTEDCVGNRAVGAGVL